MKRGILTGWSHTLALAALLMFVFSGCAETPLSAPPAISGGSTSGNAPELVATASNGEAGFTQAPDMELRAASLASGPSAEELRTVTDVDGAKGARLSCGRFKLNVPAGAFTGTATITMRVDDPNVAIVELDINNGVDHFKVPVDLTYDTTGLSLTDPVAIYYYNESTNRWEGLLTDLNLGGMPTAHLEHFSPYGAGKAGW